MSLARLKLQLDVLLAKAVEAAVRAGKELREVRGMALYDGEKDIFITSLEPFAAVEAGVSELQLVRERYGVDQSRPITLQLVYEYFARAKAVLMDSTLSDTLWADFLAELESPVWLTRCVTNLRHFHCKDLRVELGDGVSIYGRSRDVLVALGFDDGIRERLGADWSGFGASSFVLVAETSITKQPDNFITEDNNEVWLRCARAIGAMRLIASGDVGISVIFVQRVARFNVGIGGILSMGNTVKTNGKLYAWRPELLPLFNATYAALAHLEKVGYGNAPGNLDLALRAFMSTFDRFPTAMDTKLVDAITALEAVLGSETEIAFKLSFRIASLLGQTDEQRTMLLKAVKGFYDTRSRIVHGEHLRKKHSASLAVVDDLRDMVRKLLRCFVAYFAIDDVRPFDRRFFKEELDAALVNASCRDQLRESLGLTESTSRNAVLDDQAG